MRIVTALLLFLLVSLPISAQENGKFSDPKLTKIVRAIRADSIETIDSFAQLSPWLQEYLDSRGSGHESIANPGEYYARSDHRVWGERWKQLSYLGIGRRTLLMAYRRGGFSPSVGILLLEFKPVGSAGSSGSRKYKVTRQWSGVGKYLSSIDSMEGILRWIENKGEVEWVTAPNE